MKISRWDNLPQDMQDAARKFNHTYVYAHRLWVKRDAPKTYYVEFTDGWRGNIQSKGNSKDVKYITESDVNLGDLDVVHAYPALTGAFQVGDSVNILKRNPARQWQVGFCTHNALFWNANLSTIRINYDIAAAAFKPIYPVWKDIKEVFQLFEMNKSLTAQVLTNRYWLRQDGPQNFTLFRNHTSLAVHSYGTFMIHEACFDLKQELWDDLRVKVK